MRGSILVQFLGMIDIDLKFIHFLPILNTLILTSDIDVLTIFRGVPCPQVFSETIEIINLKFSAIVKEAW
jgi:hypothetical protein